MLIRWGHLQLKDLTNQDAIIIQAMICGVFYKEKEINDDWAFHSGVSISLRKANLTAISIMANIFDKQK